MRINTSFLARCSLVFLNYEVRASLALQHNVGKIKGLAPRPVHCQPLTRPWQCSRAWPGVRLSMVDTAGKSAQDGLAMLSDTEQNKKDDNLLALAARTFVTLFWRGLTLPFPMLRSVDSSSKGSSKKSDTFFSLRECMVAVGAYLSLGAVAYTRIFEEWSLVDSLYFSVVSFSTVGYGDVCPSNLPSKIFTCLFGLGGVAFLGVAIATIGSSLMEAEVEALETAQKLSRKRLLNAFEGMPKVLHPFKRSNNASEGVAEALATKAKLIQTEPSPRQYWAKALLQWLPKILPSIVILILGGSVVGRIEGWSWWNSVYYSFITAGTLGYGDYAPATQLGRLWSIIFIPVAVAAAGEFLGNAANLLTDRRRQLRNYELLHRKLDMDYLEEMDTDQNGLVDRLEYITFMLKEMGVVDQSLLDELNEQFDRLDVSNSKTLGVEDLRLMAQLQGIAK